MEDVSRPESDKCGYVASEESDTTTGRIRFRQTVERLAPGGGVEFSGAVFRQLVGPGVYVWLRGDTALYVGASATAFSRAADRRHHRIQLGEDMADDDVMLFYACATMAVALELETELIQALRPRYNSHSKWKRLTALLGYAKVQTFRNQYLPYRAPSSVLAPPGWYRPQRSDPAS
jgi:hypothetical protein